MPFEFDGDKYAKASSHQKEWGRRIIEEFRLRGNEWILDLGCGDGVLTAGFAELVPEGFVLGIDASQNMIETASRQTARNLQFRPMDIDSMDLDERFDLVFSNATLHWIKDHRTLLANVFAILNEGGTIRFNFAADGNCSHFYLVIRQVMQEEPYAEYFRDFAWPWFMPKLDGYETLLSEFPFRDAKVWGENADRHFPDSDAMVRWIDQPSIVPFLERVASLDKAGFRNTVVKRMLEVTQRDDGTYFETFRRINVSARK
jgi:trans-aconitate methyltransferase